MKHSHSLLILMVLAAVVVFLAACSAPAEGPSADDVTASFEPPRCALITPLPLGDRSFIDSAARGVERINDELPIACDIIETNGVSEHETALRGAVAQGYDLIMGLAMDAEMFTGLALEYPDLAFGSPSEIYGQELPDNFAAYQIDTHESSFLAGLVAGSMTETGIVGAVMGGDSPAVNQFFYGYKQGVLEACPDCEVLSNYLGFDFGNPTLGLETALAQYDAGADIIYQIAGRSGEGVLEAAAQTGNYAIGVDSNQDYIQPGSVIVSMIKRVDVVTYLLAEAFANGMFEGGFYSLGMADDAAGLSWDAGSTTFEDEGPADMTAKLPEVRALVEDYRTRILNGDYVVCDALDVTDVCDPLMSE